ncbi:MAG: hypothetical protein L0229_10885 [Blastocatellia bacterium]|nr:hypothetical protein [Blastocatellia bacterium]
MKQASSILTSDELKGDRERKRAQLLSAIGRLEESHEPIARKRVALAEAYFRLAILRDTDPEESLACLQKAIGLDPFHPKLFFHLGRSFHRRGDYGGAVVQYRQALRFAPASHRACVHLALALLELGKSEKEIGRAILDALSRGEEQKLAEHLARLDAFLEAQSPAADGKATAPGARGKSRRPDDEKPSSASPGDSRPSGNATEKGVASACRWQGVWRVALVDHLSGPKLIAKQIDKQLEAGAKPVDGDLRVAEYATALLFLMLSGESPKAIDKMAEGPILKDHSQHPAVRLLRAAVGLAQAESPDLFIELAEKEAADGRLPIEMICVLHYTIYGPGGENPLSDAESLKLLNHYWPEMQELHCFRELRLAILDGYARLAWRDERFEHATLLWREALSLDPFRIAVAHNLALVAARTRSCDDYQPAWNRAAELRYLYAAAAGDLQVMLEERRVMHLSFAQQSRQRYCGQMKPGEGQPSEEALQAWMSDREAIEVWLREWDLYYLNSRVRFRSPVHLLGVPRDASEQAINDARDALLHQIETTLDQQPWAGIKTFCRLSEELVVQASERARDTVERIRDLYYEQEKSEADALTHELIDRGLAWLHRMLVLLAKKVTETAGEAEAASEKAKQTKDPGESEQAARLMARARKVAAQSIPVGCLLARHLFVMPWKLLQPICADRGLIERDADLVGVFESYFIALVSADRSEPENERELSKRLGWLDECQAILPHRFELRLARCQLLMAGKRYDDAYAVALATLPLIADMEDREEADQIENNLVVMIENAAFAAMPESTRQMIEGAGGRARPPESVREIIKEGRSLLERFPHASSFRAFLVFRMIEAGQSKEAIDLLKDGLELALNEEQRASLEKALKEAQEHTRMTGTLEEIKRLLEGASQRVNQAFGEIQPGSSASLQHALEVLRGAIADARRAKDLAAKAGIKDAEQQAAEFIRQLEAAQTKLR